MSNARKSWSSILTGVANTADEAMREYVFEDGDNVVKMPASFDAKLNHARTLQNERVSLMADLHKVERQLQANAEAIRKLDEVLDEQLKEYGYRLVRPKGGD